MNFRLFVALEPPDALRRRIGALTEEMRKLAGRRAAEVKWVAPENVHLTLQFLGGVPEERVAEVERAVTGAALASRPLALELRGAGGFPSARRPRVLWLGLLGDLEALAVLVRDLGAGLAPLGFPPEERGFSAHLTIGRARDRAGAPGLAGALAEAAASECGSWKASEAVLFRSHLSPGGPHYDAIARAPLGGTAVPPGGG